MEEDYKCRNWSLNASYKYNSVSGEVFAIVDRPTQLICISDIYLFAPSGALVVIMV